MTKKQVAYRQGDVTLVRLDADASLGPNPAPEKKPDARGRIVLAEGEVTGHAHVMNKDVARLFAPTDLPEGHSILVVAETTVPVGALLEGKIIGRMAGGTIRFQGTDGVVIRFHPDDVEIKGDTGVVVKRAYSPLQHDEHDAIPVGLGTYRVMQHQTATSARRRIITGD